MASREVKVKFGADTKDATANIKKVAAQADNTASSMKKLDTQLDRNSKGFRGTADLLDGLGTALGFPVAGVLGLTRAFADISDGLKDAVIPRLGMLIGSQEALGSVEAATTGRIEAQTIALGEQAAASEAAGAAGKLGMLGMVGPAGMAVAAIGGITLVGAALTGNLGTLKDKAVDLFHSMVGGAKNAKSASQDLNSVLSDTSGSMDNLIARAAYLRDQANMASLQTAAENLNSTIAAALQNIALLGGQIQHASGQNLADLEQQQSTLSAQVQAAQGGNPYGTLTNGGTHQTDQNIKQLNDWKAAKANLDAVNAQIDAVKALQAKFPAQKAVKPVTPHFTGGGGGGGGGSVASYVAQAAKDISMALKTSKDFKKFAKEFNKELTTGSGQMSDAVSATVDKIGGSIKKLASAIPALIDAARGISKAVADAFSPKYLNPEADSKTGGMRFIDFLKKQADDTKKMKDGLKKLAKLGLNADIIQGLASQGVGALPAVQEILAGGKNEVNVANGFDNSINNDARIIGNRTAEDVTGVNLGKNQTTVVAIQIDGKTITEVVYEGLLKKKKSGKLGLNDK